MSKWKRTAFFVGILLMILGWHSQLYAWCPLAHYLIAREAQEQKDGVPEGVENYANLPDYCGSNTWNLWPPVGQQELRDEFCWSHGVLNYGVYDWPGETWFGSSLNVPWIGVYASDGRAPGKVMQILVADKLDLDGVSDEVREDLYNTVNGFRAHNAADRVVHWTFFMGVPREHEDAPERYKSKYQDYYDRPDGEEGEELSDNEDNNMSPQDRAHNAYVVHHGMKEVWADYLLALTVVYRAESADITFDDQGNFTSNPPNPDDDPDKYDDFSLPEVGFRGDAALMQLAQKVYRKNRLNIMMPDCGLGRKWLEVQNIEGSQGIQSMTDEKAEELNTLWANCPWARWSGPGGLQLAENVELDIWNTEQQHWDRDQTLVMGLPEDQQGWTHELEWTKLSRYYQYTQQNYAGSYTAHGEEWNDENDHNDWMVWDPEEVIDKYDKAVGNVKGKLYTRSQLGEQ